MIETINKDILTVEGGVICQQVNCMGKMGKGIAKDIRAKWPKVYTEYQKQLTLTNENTWEMLGDSQLVEVGRGAKLFVANLFAQYDYGTDYRRTEYGSLIRALDGLKYELQMFRYGYLGDLDIFFPYKMGCVNGGGDWDIVGSIIRKSFAHSSHNVYICCNEK